MSVTHVLTHIDVIVGPPAPPITTVIAAATGATAAATVASPISPMSLIPEPSDVLVMLVMPAIGVVDAATPRSAHMRLIAKATPAHKGRVEALTTLVAMDMDGILSET